jgi:chromosome segregation ATPase
MPKKLTKKKRTLNAAKLSHNDLPASVGLANEVRSELRAELGSLRHEIKADIGLVRAEMGSVRTELRTEIGALRAEMGVMRTENGAEFSSLRSEVQQVLVAVHRSQALMEQQRGENRIALDGLKNVTERQDRMDGELQEIRETLKVLRPPDRKTDPLPPDYGVISPIFRRGRSP